ncbi:MAG: 3-deoxy-manno-octulosonate cytidylyltransferase [Paludibacteraceae bacterium]|nr:3-deoxy-manno-octulosonate cytidylyltransferase [Paludibacteraceae bacterium]MBR0297227.1 3-deoxy-manno-octulosonate cytidylyltransferase [Paludibacteraceae bacterium]
MRFVGIIPARYASTRFPGKPLADLGGKPMIQRVYEQAKKALADVVVATDDERIYNCVKAFGGEVVMTRADHKCGTDRCLEAFEKLSIQGEAVVINIQGDEPFIQPEQIEAIKSCFDDATTQIATLVKPFTEADGLEALENPNTPKVVMAPDGTALLFSRSVIPYLRGIDKSEWLAQHLHYKHIGMYAYRAQVLKQITQLPQTPMEKAESLEQLRWLENGYKIKVAVCHTASIGIDTPADLERAITFLKQQNKQ